MKKKIITSIIIILVLAALAFVIFYNIKNGKKSTNSDAGVADVDFSSYEEKSIELNNKDVTLKTGGVYNITGNIDNGSITIETNADIKLILNDVSITNQSGPCINVVSAQNIYIELKGDNTLNSKTTDDYNGTIYSKNDLLLLGDGNLEIISNIDGIVTKDDLQIDSGNITIKADDDGLVGKDSVKITGGKLEITSTGDSIKTTNEEKGVIQIDGGQIDITSSLDGIQSISDVIINDGNITIKTGKGASTKSTSRQWMNNQTTDSIKGIKADSNIYINGGTIDINSEDDSVHSNGNIEITGGKLTMASGDDGIHADKDVTIKDGTIDVTESYEGIEGANITVDGGDIKVKSTDDGFNAAGGDGSSQGRPGANNEYNSKETYKITINGGNVYVNAAGDGLDSNGDIYINGGEVYVDGPTDNANAAIDYGDGGSYKFEITGGTVVAVGSSGMAVSPTSGTKQTSVLINLSESYTDELEFGDIKYTPSKSYNSILISSDKLTTGKEYTLKIGNKEIQTLTLSDTVTTSGSTGMNGGMRGGMQRGGNDQNRENGQGKMRMR